MRLLWGVYQLEMFFKSLPPMLNLAQPITRWRNLLTLKILPYCNLELFRLDTICRCVMNHHFEQFCNIIYQKTDQSKEWFGFVRATDCYYRLKLISCFFKKNKYLDCPHPQKVLLFFYSAKPLLQLVGRFFSAGTINLYFASSSLRFWKYFERRMLYD